MLHQYERVPHRYELDEPAAPSEASSTSSNSSTAASSIRLKSEEDRLLGPVEFAFEAVAPNVFRTTFTSPDHPLPPYPSAHRPEPTQAAAVEVATDLTHRTRTFQFGAVKATVEWSNAPVVSLYLNGAQKPIYRDLHFRSYAIDGRGVAHYSSYKKDTLHVGLGEKAAPMDLSGRGWIISASDTFGYDAYRTDPLYKHIPLLINVTTSGCVGVFSTSHARGTWAVGSEIDGMWGHFKVYRQAHGGLEEYLLVGSTVQDVVRSYAELVGFPLRVPRYMMGYIGGGMKYSMEDEPRAADAIVDFIRKCEKHDMPCTAFQMSSGYTVAEVEPKTRNVFTWNHHRFPDPRGFTRECHRRGVRLLANVKPYVLASHPAYAQLAASGAFFKDPVTNGVAVARLWSAGGGESGEGSHIDFTSTAGYDWWYDGVKDLKEVGIDAMWNDNNEYNIPSDDWQCALQTVPVPDGVLRRDVGLWGRAMHTELMGKGSHDATLAAAPNERPLVLTRSATAGTMRYAASSWSGDNVTSWEGMKGGNALALNAGFSLLQCYGHDIGGFEGPQPSPEHLVRWIQLGIHSPRFAINCFKTSPGDNLVGEVIEPWMYPSARPIIRAAIKRRYELVPYTYSLSLRSHAEAIPSQRWTGWGYEEDSNVWSKEIRDGDSQYWFGDALLVAGVYEPGKTTARVYLPRAQAPGKSEGFLNTNAPHQFLRAGRWHDISAVWHDSIAVLARVGSAIPVGKPIPTTCMPGDDSEFPNMAKDDWRGVEIFPPPVDHGDGYSSGEEAATSQTFTNTWLEDDGIGVGGADSVCSIEISYTVGAGPVFDDILVQVNVSASAKADWQPLWLAKGVDVVLPVGEERVVRLATADSQTATDLGRDAKGRRMWRVPVGVKDRVQEA